MIERRSGYSNLSMLEYCESLKSVVSQTKKVSVGRGKTSTDVLIPKYNTEAETVENIEKSCIYYKQQHEMEIQEVMSKVKDFLQDLGIMYIDWKFDNLAKSEDGTYKLFDFDASGLIDLLSKEWILEPQHYWNYNEAIKNGCITPKEIDDWGFNYNIIEDGFKLVE